MNRHLAIAVLMLFYTAVVHAEPFPGGSYQKTCHDIARSGSIVKAVCASETQGNKKASLDMRRCAANFTGLSNLNGALVCEGPLPAGSYQRTCHATYIMDNRLSAICKTERGGDTNNRIEFGNCREGFRNANGILKCGQ